VAAELNVLMDPFLVSTIILAVWGALGPLVGVRYGHELAKRSQKEHWIDDNAKEEYRELIGALFEAANVSILNRCLGRETTIEEDSTEERCEHLLYAVIYTRLFIREFVEKEQIMERWKTAFTEHSKTHDLEVLRKTLRELIEVVVDHATKLKD